MKYLLLLLPLLSFGQITLDKQAHFLAGSTISAVTYGLVLKRTEDPKKAYLISLVTPLLLGLCKEAYDYKKKGDFNSEDLAFTVVGGVSVSVVLKIF